MIQSNSENEQPRRVFGGAQRVGWPTVKRDHVECYDTIYKDYFKPIPRFSTEEFRQRYMILH